MEIKKVVLAKYEDIPTHNGKNITTKWVHTRDRICSIVGFTAIDVETKEKYEIVKTDKYGKMITYDVTKNIEYGVDVQKVPLREEVKAKVKMMKKDK